MGVPAAGRRSCKSDASTAQCALQPELFCPPAPTPRRELRFRKDSVGAGESRQRRGSEGPACRDSARHGRPSGVHPRSESVGAVLQPSGTSSSSSNSLLNERKEAVYESNKKEPLGKGFVRGHHVPKALAEDSGFQFGKPTNAPRHSSEQQGKDAIAPEDAPEHDREAHERYVRTHQAFDPGERVNRQYAWPAEVAQEKHRFGRPYEARLDGAGVRAALTEEDPAVGGGCAGATRVVQRTAEEFHRATHDPVGGRAQGTHGRPPVPEGFVFGARSKGGGASMGDILRGNYSAEEQLPDKDLGRCIREGRRNVTAETRPFGRPSRGPTAPRPASQGAAPQLFRPPPRTPAVAWQDDGNAGPALAPGCLEAKGITSDDFAKLRGRDEVASLMEGAGYKLSADKFERLWNAASRGSDQAPLRSVIQAYSECQVAA